MFNDETQEVETSENIDTQDDVDTETTTDWKAEALKWKAIADRKAKKAEQAQSVTTSEGLPSSMVERLTLKVDGYNDEEVSKIMELGGLKALQNPLVKKAVEVMRQERQAENAQVDTDGATSAFSRKYSNADLRKMSSEELEKILSQG